VTAADVITTLKDKGPLTGWELLEKMQLEALPLWRICALTPGIRSECVGKRYLRLDRNIDGYARLSPSIRREFLTYTVIGREDQSEAIEAKARRMRQEMAEVSKSKLDLAREAMAATVQSLPEWEGVRQQVCFLIAGDVTYGMAHTVPRPEVSTGKMVRGSDLDIIVVAENEASKEALKALDQAIYRKKHFLLVHPNYHEEIDYLIKDIAKVRRQLQFDSFQHMIASKILYEGEFLYGCEAVFRKIKDLVGEMGVPEKLSVLEARAIGFRQQAETSLLQIDGFHPGSPFLNLFFTREEGDEIF
jgi:hypothetical protein